MQDKIDLLLSRGYILLEGMKYFQMPENRNIHTLPEDEDIALSNLVFWHGYGFGVNGFVPDGLSYNA